MRRVSFFAGWVLLLAVAAGYVSACSSAGVVDSPPLAVTPTAAQPAPTASTLTIDTPVIDQYIEPQATEAPQTAAPPSTNTLQPTATAPAEPTHSLTGESTNPVLEIPLAGPLASRRAELSGLAWYGDHLIILPQFPDFNVDEGDGFIYALDKAEILAFLDGRSNQALEPRPVPLVAPGLGNSIAGFEGFEAISFSGDDAYMTIEAKTRNGMLGYLAKGTIMPDLSALTIDTSTLAIIPPQADMDNISDESLFVADQLIGTLYELNGQGVNASPVVHLFGLDLALSGTAPFPHVPFRITDASGLDNEGRFWVINYFFPGSGELLEILRPQEGDTDGSQTRLPWEGLGRLIELQFRPSGVTLTGAAPIQLESHLSDIRNWEGLARLDDRGFLIVSDGIPDTVLGFVPFPDVQ